MADQQAAAGGFSKRHVSGMLKFLEDEEKREKALEVAALYKKCFEDKEWEPVMANLRAIANEDHLRVVRRRPAPLKRDKPPVLETSASAPVKIADVTTPPAGLLRHSTAHSLLSAGRARTVSAPRERWDVMSRGPSTPLTPTPVGNAFAQGGYWEQLTPKTPAPPTPVTAIPYSPFSPIIPMDHEAREAYSHVKAQGEAIARSVCATRMSAISKIRNSDDVPNSLLTSKDLLKGAAITLEYKQASLKTAINPDLPNLLRSLGEDEAKIIDQYSVKDSLDLLDLDNWLLVDEQTRGFTTILDAQRETMQMHRHRRKSSLLQLPEQAVQQAWATRIMEDAERAVEADGDAASDDSDPDKGYNYNNFLRSIKHEYSSGSDLASMAGTQSSTDLTSLRSRANTGDSRSLSRETTFASPRSETSPKKSYGSLPLRSRNNSQSNSPSPEKRLSIAAANRGLSFITTNIKEEDEGEDIPSAQLSPEEKAFRRKGALFEESDLWAQQLKEMEERQTAKKARVMEEHQKVKENHVVEERQPANENRVMEECPTMKEMEERPIAKKDRIMGMLHPALRKRSRRRSSAASFESWTCEEAMKHERDSSTISTNNAQSPPQTRTQTTHDTPTHSPSISQQASPQPKSPLLDFRYSILAPPGFRYATNRSELPSEMYRRRPHVRGRSGRVREDEGIAKESEWEGELTRIESRESERQGEEATRRRFSRERG